MTLLVMALAVFAGTAFAASPLAAGPTTVPMQGTAVIVQGTATAQLRLKTQATDNSGWLLEVSLNPVQVRGGAGQGGQTIDLQGLYTLGTSQHPLASGTATGWVDSTAKGQLQVVDSASSTSLNVSFSILANGTVTLQAQGQWPQQAAAAPASATTAATAAVPQQPSSHFFWYVSRTAALVAYGLLFLNICLGIGLKMKYLDVVLEKWRAFDLHQFTALLAMAFVSLHVFSLLGDAYFSFGFKQLLAPMASPYRPLWTALGVVAFYTALAVTFSFYVRQRIGMKVWRTLHYASFVLFFIILLHGVKAGTDSSAPWTQWMYVGTGSTVVFLTLWRFVGATATPGRIPKKTPAGVSSETH